MVMQVIKKEKLCFKMRIRPTNCPNCKSERFDIGEYLYRYGPDSPFMYCHDCGHDIACYTEEEIERNKQLEEKWEVERLKKCKQERYEKYLKLHKEFNEPTAQKYNISMIKLKKCRGFSHNIFWGFESELNDRGFDAQGYDCCLGNLQIGTLLETNNNMWISTWSEKKYKSKNTTLTSLVKLLNG